MRVRVHALEMRELLRRLRDDPLAGAAVWDVVCGAVGVEQARPGDAHGRLVRARRVVEASVDHLRVAAAGFGADGGVALEEDGAVGRAGLGEAASDGETDDAAADDLVGLVEGARRKGGNVHRM